MALPQNSSSHKRHKRHKGIAADFVRLCFVANPPATNRTFEAKPGWTTNWFTSGVQKYLPYAVTPRKNNFTESESAWSNLVFIEAYDRNFVQSAVECA